MKTVSNFVIAFLLTSFFALPIFGAEIQFKATVSANGTTVLLGDIAEITGNDAENLKKVQLFPAPVTGGQRIVSAAQVRDHLVDHGITSLEHRFSGPARITVNGPVKQQSRPGDQRLLLKAEEELRKSLLAYLNRCTTDGKPENAIPWKLELDLTPQHLDTLASGGKIHAIYGGTNPLIGHQQFQAELENIHPETNRKVRVRFSATISLPPQVLVAARAIPKGKLINSGDVKIAFVENLRETDFIADPADVVGKMATNLIREGTVLNSNSVSKPILVRKGDIVTVVAKAPGFAVRSTAKAQEDGSDGDLISLEQQLKPKAVKGRLPQSSKDDSVFYARVVGIGTVETFASSSKY